jgi:hypothetical protein
MPHDEQWETRLFTGLVYGNAGCGKTPFAAQLPKPMKVFQFDPPAKALAYRQQGYPGPIDYMDDGGAFQFIVDPESKEMLIEIEYFVDLNPVGIVTQKYPCAYERFQASLSGHMTEGWQGYKSVILDSYTFCEMACVRMQQYKINPAPGGIADGGHNQKIWAGQARGIIQTDIMSVFPWIPVHALVLAHVDDQRFDEQEHQVWGISAIGKLGKLLPGAFSEVYFMYKEFDEKAKTEQSWFKTAEGQYIARSDLRVPSPCKATWEALWKHQQRTEK